MAGKKYQGEYDNLAVWCTKAQADMRGGERKAAPAGAPGPGAARQVRLPCVRRGREFQGTLNRIE